MPRGSEPGTGWHQPIGAVFLVTALVLPTVSIAAFYRYRNHHPIANSGRSLACYVLAAVGTMLQFWIGLVELLGEKAMGCQARQVLYFLWFPLFAWPVEQARYAPRGSLTVQIGW